MVIIADDTRLLKDLIQQLEALQIEHVQASSELDTERATARKLQDRVQLLEKLNKQLSLTVQSLRSQQSFVLVLIDADAEDYVVRLFPTLIRL